MWKLKPQDNNFFTLLQDLAQLIPPSSAILTQILTNQLSVDEGMEQLQQFEQQSKELSEKIIDKVGRSYIPPMDREDIFKLTKQLTGLIDIISAAVERLQLYHLKHCGLNVKELILLLTKTTEKIPLLIADLPNIRSKAEKVITLCNTVSDQEQRADYYYRHGLAALFDTCPDAIEIMKWREIFQHLEKIFDHSKLLADSIKEAVMKYV